MVRPPRRHALPRGLSMIPKSGYRFPAFAKPASAGEGRSDKIMRKNCPGGCHMVRVSAFACALLGALVLSLGSALTPAMAQQPPAAPAAAPPPQPPYGA